MLLLKLKVAVTYISLILSLISTWIICILCSYWYFLITNDKLFIYTTISIWYLFTNDIFLYLHTYCVCSWEIIWGLKLVEIQYAKNHIQLIKSTIKFYKTYTVWKISNISKSKILNLKEVLYLKITKLLYFIPVLNAPHTTFQNGIYIMELFNWYSAGFSLVIVSLLEVIAISWIYGLKRFCRDIELMIGFKPNIYWQATWLVITPIIMFVSNGLLVFYFKFLTFHRTGLVICILVHIFIFDSIANVM